WLGMLDEEFVLARVRRHASGGAGGTGPGRSVRVPREAAAVQRGGDARRAPGQPGERSAEEQAGRGEEPFGAPPTPLHVPAEPPYDLGDPVIRVEREALKLAIQRPALCGPEFDAIDPAAFTAPRHVAIRDLIAGCGGTGGAGSAQEWAALL